ncbi:helix-turn-helix domain-containing protein [Microbacterium sp.]|jgi:hypothetical protein|uniref:helix-turn-helix domain-containing protein n=1 Tax=Microbacterium sp. TaxID=51671 RepID=UPI0037C5D7D4
MTEEHEDDRLHTVLRRLGDRVHAMRLARGLSVTALSFEAALSEQRIRSLEAGRTAVPLAALVALADVFEVGIADLFGDGVSTAAASDAIDAPSSSPHVVPSPVIWGGELPPAPWMSSAPPAWTPDAAVPAPVPDAQVPPVGTPGAAVPAPAPGGQVPPGPAPVPPASVPHAVAAPSLPPDPAGSAPHRPWPTSSPAPVHADPPDPGAHLPAPSVAPSVHQRAAERGMQGASPYVFVAPGAGSGTAPRTFADLRVGPLAGRNFRSLQEFAVASVVEGHHAIPDVARVFRVPVWRLEQWVRESGHAG